MVKKNAQRCEREANIPEDTVNVKECPRDDVFFDWVVELQLEGPRIQEDPAQTIRVSVA